MFRRAFVRRLLAAAAACSALAASSAFAQATSTSSGQAYPNKPIKLIVSFAPGGLTDVIARAMQQKLAEGFGQPVIIENRPGAGGTLAEAQLARSPADGYTLLMTADSVPANPHLIPNLTYDMQKDLLPVSILVRNPLVLLVNNAVPANTLKEFVDYARVNGAKASYASPGIGTSNHLYFEVFKDIAHIDLPHVGYKGGGPAMTDLMGGHVQAILISSTLATPQVNAGKVKALAVTGDKRFAQLPNVPTFAEAGYPEFKPQQWNGLFLPAGTPPAIVSRVHAVFSSALKSPDVVARLNELGSEPVMSTPAELSTLLHRDYDVLGKLIRDRNIKAQ